MASGLHCKCDRRLGMICWRCDTYEDGLAAGLVWGAALVAMAVAIRDAHPEPLRFTSRRERWPDDFGPCD